MQPLKMGCPNRPPNRPPNNFPNRPPNRPPNHSSPHTCFSLLQQCVWRSPFPDLPFFPFLPPVPLLILPSPFLTISRYNLAYLLPFAPFTPFTPLTVYFIIRPTFIATRNSYFISLSFQLLILFVVDCLLLFQYKMCIFLFIPQSAHPTKLRTMKPQ